LLKALFSASEHRGKDATGFVARTSRLDTPGGETVTSKEPLTASRFVETSAAFRRLAHRRCSSFCGHVRAATHGPPDHNENNHPFASEDNTLFLVHNGVVGNHDEVADKYNLTLTTGCDSEVLLRLVESYPHRARGLAECLREIKGSMAVAVYDEYRDCVWLCRNGGRPLWLARLRGDRRWFFASTDRILFDSFKAVLGPASVKTLEYLAPIPENTPLELAPSGIVIAA
jgi:glucosamine 6-phosphate synthetase-like amidotransferase/phosphosugar isomerase protein